MTMCGGGGGRVSVPAVPSPEEQARTQQLLLQVQQEADAKAAAEAEAKAAVNKAQSDYGYWSQYGPTYQRELTQAEQMLGAMGLTPEQVKQYMPDVQQAYGDIAGTPAASPTPFSYTAPGQETTNLGSATRFEGGTVPEGARLQDYLGRNVLDSIINDITARERRQAANAVEGFAPVGFEQAAFGNTMDDPIIQSILGEQYGTAKTTIENAGKRGQLNPTGLASALAELDKQQAAGTSRLNTVGEGILSGYRSQLGDVASTARNAASGLEFGRSFNPTAYQQQLSSTQADLGSRLEGDIRSAIGNEQLFNVPQITQKGQSTQGVSNYQAPELVKAISNRENQLRRGVGSTGVF